MALQLCTVSGTVRDTTGTALANVLVEAYLPQPVLHTGDNSLIVNYRASTTTAADGTWSLSLIETTTISVTMVVKFTYPLGSSGQDTKTYTITVPNSASATFASLITGQV